MKTYNIGILGATGMVGRKFIKLLENHPWFKLKILASSGNSAGKTFKDALKDKNINEVFHESIENMQLLDVEKDKEKISKEVDFVFCALGLDKEKTKILEEDYAKLECPVISNNSAHRMTKDVPMIIPEINSEHAEIISAQKKRLGTKHGFIAVKPNCSIQCFVPVLSVFKNLGIKNIAVSTYQAISGAGKTFETWPEMVDNLIPFIPKEEEKTEIEPLKIWGEIEGNKIKNAENINITAQCLRVPVSHGHTAALFVSFEKKISISEMIEKIKKFEINDVCKGLPSEPKKFLHYFEDEFYPQIKFARELENGMAISVGRMREDSQFDAKCVCMSHNTIRGAAGGAILMAEMLCKMGWI